MVQESWQQGLYLTMVPPFVTTHQTAHFRIDQETQVSYQRHLLIHRYFCVVCDLMQEKQTLAGAVGIQNKIGDNHECSRNN